VTENRSRADVSVHHDEDGKPVVRFERHLDHSVERVWQALTDESELALWYATKVHIEPVPGGLITFAFPGGDPFEGKVLQAQAPNLLTFTTLDDVLHWEITPDGEGSLLVLNNVVGEPPHTPYTAAGFHITLDQLVTLLDEGPQAVHRTEMPPPDDLVEHYSKALTWNE
jgi:uncharacterized protein YndB with AHSA1/START domain